MAAADVSALIDAASAVDTSANAGAGTNDSNTTVDESTVDQGGEQHVEGGEQGEGEGQGGGEKAGAEGEGGEVSGEKDSGAGESKDPLDSTTGKTTHALRSQLKAWRDAVVDKDSPEGKAALSAVRTLHQSFERWEATKQLFPGGYKDLSSLSELVKSRGNGSIANLTQTLDAIDAIDQKLYSSNDPKQAESLVSDIISDLKSENSETAGAALKNLTNAFINELQKNGEESYAGVALPIIASALASSGANEAINAIYTALKGGDTKTALEHLTALGRWSHSISEKVQNQKNEPISAEAKKLQEERAAFTTERNNTLKGEVAKQAQKEAYSSIGKNIATLVRSPFFKGLSKVAQGDLISKVASAYRNAMGADKDLQKQYGPLWQKYLSAKNDADRGTARGRLIDLHNSWVTTWLNKNSARKVMTDTYPGLLKGGSAAAGRIAGRAATAGAKGAGIVYVASRPDDIVRNETIVVNGKTYAPADLQMMQIARGEGFVKMSNGGYKHVGWRKPSGK